MYLSRIESALKNTYGGYAVNNVWRVCRDILQDEELTKEQSIVMKEFKTVFEKAEYMNLFTYEIDSEKLYRFRELSKTLWQYICYELGLD